MLPLLLAATFLAPSDLSFPPTPVLQLGMDGAIQVRGGAVPKLRPGTGAYRAPGGTSFSFDGVLCGISLGDPPSLRLTKSMTICAWVRLESYVDRGQGAQILFRGDDRAGLDPYSLSIRANGEVEFLIQNAKNEGTRLAAPIPLRHWTHVMVSLDDGSGEMRLWLDGVLQRRVLTKIRPFGRLDKQAVPGISIGNIQYERSPYNQPLHGLLADLRIYDRALTPKEIGLVLDGWDRPIY